MHIEVADPGVDDELAVRLLRVQQAAYRIEAEIIGDDRIPPLHESLTDLVTADLTWWTALTSADDVLGAIACTEDQAGVEIDRLVVAPASHRRGVGRALVTTVIDHAGARPVTVSTGKANGPARALYRGLGFDEIGDREPVPGLWTTRLVHRPGTTARQDNLLPQQASALSHPTTQSTR